MRFAIFGSRCKRTAISTSLLIHCFYIRFIIPIFALGIHSQVALNISHNEIIYLVTLKSLTMERIKMFDYPSSRIVYVRSYQRIRLGVLQSVREHWRTGYEITTKISLWWVVHSNSPFILYKK